MRMLAWVIISGLFSLHCASKGTKQPWPTKVDRVGLCCSVLSFNLTSVSTLDSNSKALSSCLANLEDKTHEKARSAPILLVTIAEKGLGDHAISNIDIYAPYQEAVLRSYAEHNQFDVIARTGVEDITNNEEIIVDARWNKIQLLMELANNSSQTDSDQLLVWIGKLVLSIPFNIPFDFLCVHCRL